MELTKEEKDILIELICNEQTIHMITKYEYETEKYNTLEELKVKLRRMQFR